MNGAIILKIGCIAEIINMTYENVNLTAKLYTETV